MNYKSVNISSSESFTDIRKVEIYNGNKNISVSDELSNNCSLMNTTLLTGTQESTIICSSANDLYNASTINGSINSDNLYNDTTYDANLSNLHDDIVHDLNIHSLYNNITLSDENIHDVNNNSATCAHNLVDLGLKSKGFRIGHINIQSIQNKIDQIDIMLNHSNNDVHVFGLSETKLKHFHTDSAFQLDNYQLFRKDRFITNERKEEGGGIIVYCKNEINCKRRCDLEVKELECLWLEIFPKNAKSFLIGNIYRNPNEAVIWNEIFENNLENILKEQKELYLLGDFNRDLLNLQTKTAWLEYMEPFGLFQNVNEATRITSVSATLIDHIYCNIHDNIKSIDVPQLGLSDHFAVFLTRKPNSSLPKKSHHTISYRSFKNFNEENFITDLQSAPWDTIKIFENINEIVEAWYSIFLDIAYSHIPIKQHRVKKINNSQNGLHLKL